MTALEPLLAASLVMFAATAFRTAFGFGEALIAVPLLSLLLPIQLATPIAVLASIVVALVSLLRDWEHVDIPSALICAAGVLVAEGARGLLNR